MIPANGYERSWSNQAARLLCSLLSAFYREMDGYASSEYLIYVTLNCHPSCSLEFNIHQLILSDLATSVGASKDDPADPTVDTSIDLITSNVTTRAISKDVVDVNAGSDERVFMVCVPPASAWLFSKSSVVRFQSEMQYRVRGALCEHIGYTPPNYSFCLVGRSSRYTVHRVRHEPDVGW